MIFIIILLELVLIWSAVHFVRKNLIRYDVKHFKTLPLLIVLVIFTLIPFIYYQIDTKVIDPSSRSMKFSREEWNNTRSDRYKMKNDIIEKSLFIGMHKKDLIELLGKDFKNEKCSYCIAYSTGDPSVFSFLDSDEVTVFNFDKDSNTIKSVTTEVW